jgi:hypothetical protein
MSTTADQKKPKTCTELLANVPPVPPSSRVSGGWQGLSGQRSGPLTRGVSRSSTPGTRVSFLSLFGIRSENQD